MLDVVSGLIALVAVAAPQAEPPSVVAAQVEQVIDGDTLDVTAKPWPGQVETARIRVAGIDAPEIFSPRCGNEMEFGRRADERSRQLLGRGTWVHLVLVDGGHLDAYGRVVADVILADGRDFGAVMRSEGLAVPYRRNRGNPWCQGGKP